MAGLSDEKHVDCPLTPVTSPQPALLATYAVCSLSFCYNPVFSWFADLLRTSSILSLSMAAVAPGFASWRRGSGKGEHDTPAPPWP